MTGMEWRVAKLGVGLLMLGLAWLPGTGRAMTLLSNDEALKEMFGTVDKLETETRTLTPAEATEVKARLGGTLVHTQKGSESKAVQEKPDYTFFFAVKEGKRTGVALIEEQPGKWGPVQFIIAMDPASGKVVNLAVLSYSEKRGRPIARHNFLDQFIGKSGADPIQVHKDIRAVSGATISSEATCFAVKKSIALYELLYLKKK